MPFLAQVVGLTLQIYQVCTPNPAYLAAQAKNLEPQKLMMIQPATCVGVGNPLLGKKGFFLGTDAVAARKCKDQQAYWSWVAAKQGVTIKSWCWIENTK